MRRGDHAAACARFRESERLDPAVGTWLNLGLCEEGLGHWASAWEYYQRVLHAVPAADGRAVVARAQLDALDPRMPRVVFRLSPEAPTTTVVAHDADEYGVSSFGVPLPMDVGDHTFVARADGFAARTYQLLLREGERREFFVQPGAPVDELHPAPAPNVEADPSPRSASPSTPEVPTRAGHRTAGFVVGGIGVAALSASVVAAAMVLENKNIVERECDARGACSPAGLDAGRRVKIWGNVGTATFATGVVAAGAGLYLILSSGSAGRATRVTAAPASGGGFVSIASSF